MASSGTRTFALSIADVIQEAYERLGVSSKGGYDLITARRSLNLLMIKWINQGVNLFTLHVESTAVNTFANNVYPTFTLSADNYSDILRHPAVILRQLLIKTLVWSESVMLIGWLYLISIQQVHLFNLQ